MSANMRVQVPAKGYDHHDGNAVEGFQDNAWVGHMNDGTRVYLYRQTLKQIIDAYLAGDIQFAEDGTIKSMKVRSA